MSGAFEQFRARGIDSLVVDLRYNGGGLVDTATLLNDPLGGVRSSADTQLRLMHNARHAGANVNYRFDPQARSVRPVRIAFLTTEATASARVININSMAPWVEVAIVGEDTLDQPLGTATEGVTAAAGSDRYPLPLHPAPALRWPPGVG